MSLEKNVYIFIQIILRVLESILYILQNDPIYIFEYNFVRKNKHDWTCHSCRSTQKGGNGSEILYFIVKYGLFILGNRRFSSS